MKVSKSKIFFQKRRAIVAFAVSVFCFQNQGFSQKAKAVEVTGTVCVSSTASSGIIGEGSTNTPQHPFPDQPIYFISEKDTTSTTTSPYGVFKLKLVPGTYTVYQEGGLKNTKGGMVNFGSCVVVIKGKNDPFMIVFKNSSNRRSSMQSGPSKSGTLNSEKK